MKTRRKCRHCQCFFYPDHRNRTRQRYCAQADCRRASKAASQRRWLDKPENQDYFRGPEQVARVQAWRRANPKRRTRTACPKSATPSKQKPTPVLQDPLIRQVIDFNKKNEVFSQAVLQETLTMQVFVLTGLIAKFTDSVLQEDIAHMEAQLVRLGREIVGGRSPPAL